MVTAHIDQIGIPGNLVPNLFISGNLGPYFNIFCPYFLFSIFGLFLHKITKFYSHFYGYFVGCTKHEKKLNLFF